MAAMPLTAYDREQIGVALARRESPAAIALSLDRHPSTIGREIGRNGGVDGYSAVEAEARAVGQRSRPKKPKLVADRVLARHVTKRLKAKDSPMTIAIELARGVWGSVSSISHETIYQAIYNPGRGLEPGLCTGHLKRRSRKHRGRRTPGSHSLGTFTSISARPLIADLRVEVGHLEGDLIVGAYNRSALITLFDRASRYLWLSRIAAKTADAAFEALLGTLNRIPELLRLTLTWDQGSEMARHHELAAETGIDIYIADPHSPWQRPTNENGNAHVRRYVGKGTDLSVFTTHDLRAIETRINTTPRRILGWATATDLYTAATR